MKVTSMFLKEEDQVPPGSVVIGRADIDTGTAVYRALVLSTPEGATVAVYLDKKRGVFMVVPAARPT